jgi:tetratricopeptide (TPR) repeat protein
MHARLTLARLILALFCSLTCLVALAPARAARTSARPSQRYRDVFVRYDSLRARNAGAESERWLTDLAQSPAAVADSDLRIVADAHRSTLLAFRGQREAAQRIASAGIARGAATRDTLLLCQALFSHALGDVLAGTASDAAPVLRRLLAASRAARLPRFEGQARLDLAYIDLLAEHHAAAERGYRAALRLLSPVWDAMSRRVAQVGLGRALVHEGRLDEARVVYADVIREARAQNDAYNLASALNNLATLEWEHGDPADAVPAYEQAIELQRRFGRADEQLQSSVNLAVTHFRLDEPARAVQVLEAARPLLTARLRPATRASYHMRYGMALRELDRFDEGFEQLRLAWAVVDSFHLRPEPALISERALALGRAGHVDDALRSLDGWVADVSRFRPPADSELLQVRAMAARVLSAAGDYRGAVRRIEALLRDVPDATRERRTINLYNDLALARAAAGDASGAREAALTAMSQAAHGRFSSGDPMWDSRGFDRGTVYWGDLARIVGAPSPGVAARERLRMAFDRYHEIEAVHSRSQGLHLKAVTLAALQGSVLQPGELMLEILPGLDSSYVFAVSRESVRGYNVPGAYGGIVRVRQMHELAQRTDADVAPMRQSLAVELGSGLLSPVTGDLRRVKRLLVVDGAVGQAYPWPMLVAPGDPRALIDRFETVSLPSLCLFANVRATRADSSAKGLFVLANSVDAKGHRLAGVAEETRWISGRYTDVMVSAPRSRSDATRALARMGTADVVHVSAHFDTDPENPWRSGILLGDPSRSGAYLRVHDLVPVRIRARLAVLTGCTAVQSDLRQAQPGERGLAGAFLHAGARAVIGARWPIPDADGKAFSQAFYTALERGLPAGEALRQAQLALRRDPATAAPLHWAGFTLVGDPLVTAKLPRRSIFGIVP